MNLVQLMTRARGRAVAPVEARAVGNLPLATLDQMMDWAAFGGGPLTAAGVEVSPERALTLAPVFACVRVLAESVGSLPFITYRRLSDGGKERAEGHPLYDLLRYEPNPEMTAQEFWEVAVAHLCLWGNFYAEVERNPYGPVALWPLRPDRMRLARTDAGDLWYLYTMPNGEVRPFAWTDMFHVRDLSLDGMAGLSRIRQAREAIGLGLATEAFGARFFGNDSRPGGVLTHPGRLAPDAAERVKASWEAAHRGEGNRWRVAVLEEGMSWTTIGVPPEDAQFLETRKYQRAEVAGLFRVPPHMIGDLERATFSNIEHQSIDFTVHTLRPWLTRIEQAVRRDLFRISTGKRTHFAEFLVDGLLRGDAQARANALATQRQNGVITANEWREIENRNPLDGGDALLVNGNMMAADRAAAPGEVGAVELTLLDQVNAAAALIRSGFEPQASLAAAGLPPIDHLGLLPVTVQKPVAVDDPTIEPLDADTAEPAAPTEPAPEAAPEDGA